MLMHTKTILVTVILIAAIGIIITTSAKQVLAAKFTLKVHNQSTSFENFQVFQKDPDLGLQGTSTPQGTSAKSVEQEVLGEIAKSEGQASSELSDASVIHKLTP